MVINDNNEQPQNNTIKQANYKVKQKVNNTKKGNAVR